MWTCSLKLFIQVVVYQAVLVTRGNTASDITAISPFCSQALLGRTGEGVITSYNYPFNYRHNLTCTYSIVLPSSSQLWTVCLTFYRFSLESNTPFCYFDYLKIGGYKYCAGGLWQWGEQPTEIKANLWTDNFCWLSEGTSFDLVFDSDDSVSAKGFYLKYKIYPEDYQPQTSITAPCSSDNSFTCFNRRCIRADQVCDGHDDCDDNSDESYTHARCGEETVFSCDFSIGGTNGYCSFDNEGWYRTDQKIGSDSRSGPLGDHTNSTSGFYVYTDGSKQTARLLSPEHSLQSDVLYCLSFWYFIYGEKNVTFRVFTSKELAYFRPEWQRMKPTADWVKGQLALISQPKLQVMFIAELSPGFTGVALDDVSMLEGPCTHNDVACNFELSTCGWDTRQTVLKHKGGEIRAQRHWTIHSNPQGSGESGGPQYDHSSPNGGGSYLYFNNTRSTERLTALLVSPSLSSFPGDQHCLEFYYHMIGGDVTSAILHVHHFGTDSQLQELWSGRATIRQAWISAYVQVDASGPFQFVIEGSLLAGGEIALDQVVVEPGACTQVSEPACESGQYLCKYGDCISMTYLCDGIEHCVDGSDEDWRAKCIVTPTEVLPTQPSCSRNQFVCEDGQCISRALRCNGQAECRDSSDESVVWANCSKGVATTESPVFMCPEEEFTCEGEGRCLPMSLVCDGTADCLNGSDEDTQLKGCLGIVMKQSSLTAGGVAGICVGIFLFLLLLMLIVVYMKKRRRKEHVPPPPRSETTTTAVSTISNNSHSTVMGLPPENFGFSPGQDVGTELLPADEAPPPYDAVKAGSATLRPVEHQPQSSFNRQRRQRSSDPSIFLRRNQDRRNMDVIYSPRNYVPDPTEPMPNYAASRRGPLPQPPMARCKTEPHNNHRGGVKLGTTSLRHRRNYMNQLPHGGYDSDSTLSNNTEHIYETLNPPSDNEHQSYLRRNRNRPTVQTDSTNMTPRNAFPRDGGVPPNYEHFGSETPYMVSQVHNPFVPSSHERGPPQSFGHYPFRPVPTAQTRPTFNMNSGEGMVPHASAFRPGIENSVAVRPGHRDPRILHQRANSDSVNQGYRGHTVGNNWAPPRMNGNLQYAPHTLNPMAYSKALFQPIPKHSVDAHLTSEDNDGELPKRNVSTPDSQSRLLPNSNNSSFDHSHTSQPPAPNPAAIFVGNTIQSTEI